MDTALDRKVFVCRHRTCRRDGADAVWECFRTLVPNGAEETGCLGLCGAGPMVLVIPDEVYYWRVNPTKAAAIVAQHLQRGEVQTAWLHPRLHPHPNGF
ncbi:MAG: (2Fe-2S) ferredoxin domain-containing protein [Pseudanabaenaceae cyanobacterium]